MNSDKVYVVVITSFLDDYKPRGERWSNVDAVKLFHSEGAMRDYVRKHKIEVINECSYRRDEDDDKYFDTKGDLKDEYTTNDEEINRLYEIFNEGEFVPVHYDCEIREFTGSETH